MSATLTLVQAQDAASPASHPSRFRLVPSQVVDPWRALPLAAVTVVDSTIVNVALPRSRATCLRRHIALQWISTPTRSCSPGCC